MIQPMYFYLNKNDIDEVFLIIGDDVVNDIMPWYLVSNKGNIFSTYSNRILTKTLNYDGYYVCTLRTKNNIGITSYIHRIEKMVFDYNPNYMNLSIDHIDCNKINNNLSNLEWVTLAENTRRAVKNNLLLTGEKASWTKVKDDQVHQICKLYIDGYGLKEISKIINCGVDSVFSIVHDISRYDISSMYDIESRYRGKLSDEEIHHICSIYQTHSNLSYDLLKDIIYKDIPKSKDNQNILRNLYRHDKHCFYNISSKYNY